MKTIPYKDILLEKNINIIKNTLIHDGIMIYPTDTLYGMGGNFFSLRVIEKIDAIKKRTDMPYSVMIPGPNMLEHLVDSVPDVFHDLYRKLLPGKFTFLFTASEKLNPTLLKGNKKIGIRIPDTPLMLKLIDILNFPIITTSVNRSGEPPLNDPETIYKEFRDSAELLIDKGTLPDSNGSTILDITGPSIQCVRKGDDFDRLNIVGLL
jgi:L-threonylcarbamoyladenylate synthase